MGRKDLSWVAKFGDCASSCSDGGDGSWSMTEHLEKSFLCLSCSAPPLASMCGCWGVCGGAEPILPSVKSVRAFRG